MDDSEIAFKAAKKILDLVKNGNSKESVISDQNYPKIVAFHSIDHHKFPKYMPIMVPSGFGGRYTVPMVDYRKIQEEYKYHGEKILKKTKDLFDKKKIEIEIRLIDNQKPEDYIKEIIGEENFDLIVLGTKGEHSTFERIISGSVTQEVVNEAPCDVLVVSQQN